MFMHAYMCVCACDREWCVCVCMWRGGGGAQRVSMYCTVELYSFTVALPFGAHLFPFYTSLHACFSLLSTLFLNFISFSVIHKVFFFNGNLVKKIKMCYTM